MRARTNIARHANDGVLATGLYRKSQIVNAFVQLHAEMASAHSETSFVRIDLIHAGGIERTVAFVPVGGLTIGSLQMDLVPEN